MVMICINIFYMKKKNVVLCAIGVIIGILIFYVFSIIGYRFMIIHYEYYPHDTYGIYFFIPGEHENIWWLTIFQI